jgi:hypothetical protein
LVLTTKRLAFLGERRTNSTELGDLIGVHAFADSIKLHRERKQFVMLSTVCPPGPISRRL